MAIKKILIKVVFQAIPTYSMSVFFTPLNFCRKLTYLISNFWWGIQDHIAGSIRRLGVPYVLARNLVGFALGLYNVLT